MYGACVEPIWMTSFEIFSPEDGGAGVLQKNGFELFKGGFGEWGPVDIEY